MDDGASDQIAVNAKIAKHRRNWTLCGADLSIWSLWQSRRFWQFM